MNDFYRHKKSDKIKWLFTSIAFLLMAVLIVGICLQIFGKGKMQPSEWFKKSEQVANIIEPDFFVVTSASTTSAITCNAQKIYSSEFEDYRIATDTKEAYLLTGDCLSKNFSHSDYDYNLAFTFNIEWKSSSSSWQKGKKASDYVTYDVLYSDDYGYAVIVECKQPFGAQIQLICLFNGGSQYYTFDYRRVVEKIEYSNQMVFTNSMWIIHPLLGNRDFTCNYELTTGTTGGAVHCLYSIISSNITETQKTELEELVREISPDTKLNFREKDLCLFGLQLTCNSDILDFFIDNPEISYLDDLGRKIVSYITENVITVDITTEFVYQREVGVDYYETVFLKNMPVSVDYV